MMSDAEKRKQIFENYKKSIKKAKFAPLGKNALDIGNPLKSDNENPNENLAESSGGFNEKLLLFKIKKLEKKLERMYFLNILAIILACVALVFAFR